MAIFYRLVRNVSVNNPHGDSHSQAYPLDLSPSCSTPYLNIHLASFLSSHETKRLAYSLLSGRPSIVQLHRSRCQPTPSRLFPFSPTSSPRPTRPLTFSPSHDPTSPNFHLPIIPPSLPSWPDLTHLPTTTPSPALSDALQAALKATARPLHPAISLTYAVGVGPVHAKQPAETPRPPIWFRSSCSSLDPGSLR